MAPLRGVVFDLDGTLVDSEPLWEEAETVLAAAAGIQWTSEDAAQFFGRPLRETTQSIIDRGLDMELDAAIDQMLDYVADSYRTRLPWLPGAQELLVALRDEGIESGIGSMSFRCLVLRVQEAAPEGVLREVVGGDELSRGKPDPEVFLTAMERLGITPEETIVVEDSPTGIAAAVASGAAVLAVPPSEEILRQVEGQPVSIARSLAQVDISALRAIHGGQRLTLW